MTGRPLLALAVLLAACSSRKSDHPSFDNCEEVPCDEDEVCVDGFCVGKGEAQGGKGGMTGDVCMPGSPPEDCYEADDKTQDVGECRGGQQQCVAGVYSLCLGQVLPAEQEQECNGKDDDCDGTTDEFGMSCETDMLGVCNMGEYKCHESFAVCEPSIGATEEVCDGEDNDCNGETDELGSAPCFPEGAQGCTPSDGTFTCLGLCAPGVSACTDGKSECMDAVVGDDEVCGATGQRATDEDCDGRIDEGCTCTLGNTKSCYGGPAGTDHNLPCKPGELSCVVNLPDPGQWGDECDGEVLPSPETCQNTGVDNDCDGTPDDIGVGEPCTVPTNLGICRFGTMQCRANSNQPVCVTPQPGAQTELCDSIDQDCDGSPVNGFDFNSNATCGNCMTSCNPNSQMCCGGNCTPLTQFETDLLNCGACGVRCGDGQFCCQGKCTNGPSGGATGGPVPQPPEEGLCDCAMECGEKLNCCYTECVDLQTDARNCGACGNDCTRGGSYALCREGYCTN